MKYTKKLKVFSGAVILFFSVVSYSNNERKTVSFYIYHLKSINCPSGVGKQFSSIIAHGLKDDSFVLKDPGIRIPGNFNYTGCISVECVSFLKKEYPDGIIILGLINRTEIKSDGRYISKYAAENMKDVIGEKFKLHLIVCNLKNNTLDFTFKKEFKSKKLLLIEAGKIAQTLKEYYRQKQIVKERDVEKKIIEKTIFGVIPAGVTVSPSFICPLGYYSRVVTFGYGLDTALNMKIMPYSSISITPKLGVYNFMVNKDHIKSAQLLYIAIDAGYRFQIFTKFVFTPSVGFGYLFHILKEDKDALRTTSTGAGNYKTDLYYNPSVDFNVELLYSLTNKFGLIFSPSYRFYIDSNSIYSALYFNVGIRMALYYE